MASSAVCILLSLVYTIFLMRGKKLEKKISLRDVLKLCTFKDGLGLVFRKRERGQRMVIITIIIICILCQFSWGTRSSLLFLVHKYLISAGSWESITTTYVRLILGPNSLMTRLTQSSGQASFTPSATFPRCSFCPTLHSARKPFIDFSDSGNFSPGSNPYKQTEYARCSCLKVSNHFSFLIIWYLLFFHQSWTFVLVPRLLSSAISSIQGLVVKFPFFLLINTKMISVIKRSLKVYQLVLNTQKFDDVSIPLGISRPFLVSLCPARRPLSGITEFLKSNGNSKIFSDFQNLIQVPLF